MRSTGEYISSVQIPPVTHLLITDPREIESMKKVVFYLVKNNCLRMQKIMSISTEKKSI